MKHAINSIITAKGFRKLTRLASYHFIKKRVLTDLQELKKYDYSKTAGINSVAYIRSDFWLKSNSSNGAVSHTVGIVDAMNNMNLDISIYTICRMDFISSDILQVECKPNGWLCGISELEEMEYNKQLLDLLSSNFTTNRPDFIYQRYGRNNYAGVLAAKKLGIPIVLEYNGSEIWMSHNWSKKLRYEELTSEIELTVFKSAELIVANAVALKNELVARGVNKDRIIVIPNGVNEHLYHPEIDGSYLRKQLNISTDEIVVTFAGSFGPWHGATVLAKSIDIVYSQNNKVKFLFIGDGGALAEVKEIVSKTSAHDNVLFTGIIPHKEMPQYLAASDILVSPQFPNPDGTPFFGSPTKLFEYMAMGKSIVASRLDQLSEILKDGYSALLITPDEQYELANAILNLASNPTLRAKLGEGARKTVVDQYTWNKHVEIILKSLLTIS